MTDLTQALAELRQMELTYGQLWTAREVMQTQNADNCKSIATVLNAALSGTMIPRADADLVVALMVEKAAGVIEAQGQWMLDQNLVGNGFDLIQQGKVIRALVHASALADLQALRDLARLQFDGLLADATKMWGARCDAVTARAEAANATLRAQVERLTGALTRQGDNMAFVVNHFTLPDAYYDKFIRELGEDRAALTEGAAP